MVAASHSIDTSLNGEFPKMQRSGGDIVDEWFRSVGEFRTATDTCCRVATLCLLRRVCFSKGLFH